MKRKSVLLMLLAVLLLLGGCGGETMIGHVVRNITGENIRVSVKAKGGYDLKKNKGAFQVTKDKKAVLEVSVETLDEWNECSRLVNSGEVEAVENGDEKLVWKSGNDYCSIFMVTPMSYIFTKGTITADVTESDIKAAMATLVCEETMDDPDEYIEL